MTNVKYNRRPFEAGLDSFVSSLFSELPELLKTDFNNSERKGTVPANVKETEKGYILELVAPGFEKTDFSVKMDQNILTISGEKKKEANEGNEKEIRREYSFGSFKRSFTLDEKIDATGIAASYINGVLVLNLPRKEAVKASATTITIN